MKLQYISHQYVQTTCLGLHITAKEQQTNDISDEQIQNKNCVQMPMWHVCTDAHCSQFI